MQKGHLDPLPPRYLLCLWWDCVNIWNLRFLKHFSLKCKLKSIIEKKKFSMILSRFFSKFHVSMGHLEINTWENWWIPWFRLIFGLPSSAILKLSCLGILDFRDSHRLSVIMDTNRSKSMSIVVNFSPSPHLCEKWSTCETKTLLVCNCKFKQKSTITYKVWKIFISFIG